MIRTKRLLIRRVRPTDAQDMFEIYSDPEVMRYWDTLPDTDLSQSEARATRFSHLPEPLTYFGIEHEGKLIGAGGVHSGDEIGYILSRNYWRKGFMREAFLGMMPYLFDTLNTDQLTADIDPRNEASAAFLRSLGFQKTGEAKNTYCVGDVWTDSHYYALQRPS